MQPFDTARLHLRPVLATDAPALFALDSDPATRRYLGGPPAAALAESAAKIALIQAEYAADGISRWAVVLRDSGTFIGLAGLRRVAGPVNGQRNFFDLGYRYLPRYWGQGYGEEAARPWLRYGFGVLGLPRVCAYAVAENAASRRILEKIGMQPGGEFRLEEDGKICAWYEAAAPLRLP